MRPTDMDIPDRRAAGARRESGAIEEAASGAMHVGSLEATDRPNQSAMVAPMPHLANPEPRRGLARAALGWSAVLLALTAVYLQSVAITGASWVDGPTSPDLRVLGARIDADIAEGEWHRLVVSMFLHADLAHLAINGLWLGLFGVTAARLGGLGQSLAGALLAGVVGQFVSWAAWQGAGSVGASGAVMGLGALCGTAAWRLRHRLPAERRGPLALVLLLGGALLIIGPLGLEGVDHAAHLGGLAAGLALGALPRRKWLDRAQAAVAGALLVASMVAWALADGSPLR